MAPELFRFEPTGLSRVGHYAGNYHKLQLKLIWLMSWKSPALGRATTRTHQHVGGELHRALIRLHYRDKE